VIVAFQGCVIVALQDCVIVALRCCVIVALQGCVIVALQGCVIAAKNMFLPETYFSNFLDMWSEYLFGLSIEKSGCGNSSIVSWMNKFVMDDVPWSGTATWETMWVPKNNLKNWVWPSFREWRVVI
jgi:hypothetical protein